MTLQLRDFGHMKTDLNGKGVLVTGGTGSFGRALVKHITENFTPSRLVVYSRDELKQFEMAQEFSDREFPFLRYFIGDVRDADRLEMAMRGIDYVIHAAAMKQVEAAEYNPIECIKTNIHGAENVVRAALRGRVQKVVALSTDKAANPANLYGASKLAADKIFVAANALAGGLPTRFSCVRYGNVLGSRGSVVPFFRRLIGNGAESLPITDPRMTRFWILLDQGIDVVLSSLEIMRGGEIFVPKIPSIKVVDLATAMAPGLKQVNVGIRPGEKLHESLITVDDGRHTIELPDRYIIEPSSELWRRDDYKHDNAQPVPDGFVYTSDTNHEWLRGDELKSLLERVV